MKGNNNIPVAPNQSNDGRAQVIGVLRKDKIGKPILVVELFVLFAIVLIALPFMNTMFNDESSSLYKALHGTVDDITTTTVATDNDYLDASKSQLLSTSLKMHFNNLYMEDFSISGNTLNCTMYSYNGVMDMDGGEYYLNIYSSSGNLVGAMKITGSYDYEKTAVSLISSEFNFNSSYQYSVKVVKMKEADYPDITITSDESGLGFITCSKDKRVLTYNFKNQYLISMSDTESYAVKDYTDNTKYLAIYSKYQTKVALFGSLASTEENDNGFTYKAVIDLTVDGYTLPEGLEDNKYYPLDSRAKIIKYALIGQGYACK